MRGEEVIAKHGKCGVNKFIKHIERLMKRLRRKGINESRTKAVNVILY